MGISTLLIGLTAKAPENTPVYFIDPKPSIDSSKTIEVIAEKASVGVSNLVEKLLQDE